MMPVQTGDAVWVLHIRYVYDDEICVYPTEHAAREALAAYCRGNWVSVADDEPIPDALDAVYARYFQDLCEVWEIEQITVG